MEERFITASKTDEDASELRLRPQRLHEYTGQNKTKENLAVFIQVDMVVFPVEKLHVAQLFFQTA